MIKIDFLKNHPHAIPALANIWHEVLGKIWVPDVPVENVIARFSGHRVIPVIRFAPYGLLCLNLRRSVSYGLPGLN
jgi:hypothetical protein